MLFKLLSFYTLLNQNDLIWLVLLSRGEKTSDCELKLDKNVTKKHEMDMSWWRTCLPMRCFEMENNDATEERELLSSLNNDRWKAHQNSEQEEDSSGDYTIQ